MFSAFVTVGAVVPPPLGAADGVAVEPPHAAATRPMAVAAARIFRVALRTDSFSHSRRAAAVGPPPALRRVYGSRPTPCVRHSTSGGPPNGTGGPFCALCTLPLTPCRPLDYGRCQ